MPEPLIVLTGAAGCLGSVVHRVLLEAGKNVRATDRTRIATMGQQLIQADLEKFVDVRRILEGGETMVHLAYDRHPDEYLKGYTGETFDNHIRMNRQVFHAACEAGIKKIVFASSIQVVARQLPRVSANQPPRSLPLDEISSPEPDNWYSLAKLCSEEILGMLRRVYGIDYVVLRFPLFVDSVPIAQPELFEGRLGEAFSYLTTRDAADLILKIIDAELPGGRTYLPASRRNTQGLSIAEIIRKYYSSVELRKAVGEIESLVDLSTLVRDTGWEPQDLSQPAAQTTRPAWRGLRAHISKWLPTSSSR